MMVTLVYGLQINIIAKLVLISFDCLQRSIIEGI